MQELFFVKTRKSCFDCLLGRIVTLEVNRVPVNCKADSNTATSPTKDADNEAKARVRGSSLERAPETANPDSVDIADDGMGYF